MDLHWMDEEPTEEERLAVDQVLGAPTETVLPGARLEEHVVRGGRGAAESERHLLLPALHGVQDEVGWISKGALNYICQRLRVPPAEAFGVASFYALFSLEPAPKRVAHVCEDLACRLAGSEALLEELDETLEPGTFERSPCLGHCERAPAAFFQLAGEENWTLAPATAEAVAAGVSGGEPASDVPLSTPQTARADERETLRLLHRAASADPENLDDYRAHGGYRALRRAVSLGPDGVLREVKDSGVRGRGGAAFPMGVKWDAVAKAPIQPHYLVCNADESEPGTFKDRVLMERDPFALLESMTIAGYATGCQKGFIYIRGEYPLAEARLRGAIETATRRGFLGEDVLGEGFRFDVELRRGAGAYICGEETALFNSIEGYRGEPRNKPPFPTQVGLFGKPTVVNNVETLVNVLQILEAGGPAFASIGTEASSGPKLFCVSGAVVEPGLYEVSFGTTLREVLDLAGGVPRGRELTTVLLGGAAGAFVTPDELDVPLTFEGTRAIGATLGSGVVLAFDDRTDLGEMLLRIAAFFRDESCGQCVPCRVGTVRQEEALKRYLAASGNGAGEREAALLTELDQVMRDASICGLGHTAASALQSALKRDLLSPGGSTP